VSGAVVTGTVGSLGSEQRESFLRFREGLGNVQVIGFDEIGERLKHLHTLLSNPGDQHRSVAPDQFVADEAP
jgi:hypothetical protein